MKKILVLFIYVLFVINVNAQENNSDSVNFEIVNDQKFMKNEKIFQFHNNLKTSPLCLINGVEVQTLAFYYDQSDFKKITVLAPREAIPKYGKKGKYGAIIVELKDWIKEPIIELPGNRLRYFCNIKKEIVDTTKEYYDKVSGADCNAFDLDDSNAPERLLYIGIDNEIKFKHLGVGWDRITISMAGGIIFGTSGERIIRVSKEGNVKLTINTNDKPTVFKLKAVPLPAPFNVQR